MIFPPVDYVIIQKKYRKASRTIEESGFVSFKIIESALGQYLEDFPCEIPNLKVLKPHNAQKIEKEFNALEMKKEIQDFGNLISFDSFVNFKQCEFN